MSFLDLLPLYLILSECAQPLYTGDWLHHLPAGRVDLEVEPHVRAFKAKSLSQPQIEALHSDQHITAEELLNETLKLVFLSESHKPLSSKHSGDKAVSTLSNAGQWCSTKGMPLDFVPLLERGRHLGFGSLTYLDNWATYNWVKEREASLRKVMAEKSPGFQLRWEILLKDWDAAMWPLNGGLPPGPTTESGDRGKEAQIYDFIPLLETHTYQFLSQGQEADNSLNGANIVTCLQGSLDLPTVLIILSSLVVPYMVILGFLELQRCRDLSCDTAVFRVVRDYALDLLDTVVDAIMLLLGKTEYLFRSFIDPLMNPARRGYLVRTTIALLTVSLLIESRLYGELFTADLRSIIIQKPLVYIDSAADFLRLRPKYNLTLISLAATYQQEAAAMLSPEMEEIVRKYETVKKMSATAFESLTAPEVVRNVGTTGCESILLADPDWHDRNYHCSTERSPPIYIGILINGRSPHAVRLRQVIRRIFEADLRGRHYIINLTLRQLRSMTAHRFRQQHGRRLPAITFNSIRILARNAMLVMVAIFILKLCWILIMFLNRKILITVVEDN